MTPTDDVLEDESYNRPWYVVDGSSWRNSASSGEDDWEAAQNRSVSKELSEGTEKSQNALDVAND